MYNKKVENDVTLCVLKPDAYERKITDNIINDIQKEGFETTNFVQKRLTVDDVCVLYHESKEQPYFIDLLSYMTSGISVFFLVKAKDAVNRFNDFVGATNPSCSVEGTL